MITRIHWINQMMSLLDKSKIKEIQETFDGNVSQIDKLLEKDFKEPSIIMIVSTFEAFMSDIFELNYQKWFKHISKGELIKLNNPKTRREIYKYLREINAYDEFLEKRYIYLDNTSVHDFAETQTLYEVLLGKILGEDSKNKKEKGKINFQSLKGKSGVFNAYKAVFNVNLMHSLDEKKSASEVKWKELNEFFAERHEIIHKGKKTIFSEERIHNVLDSIKYMRNYLIDELINEGKRGTQGIIINSENITEIHGDNNIKKHWGIVNGITDKNIKYYENCEYSVYSRLKIKIEDIDYLNKKVVIEFYYNNRKIQVDNLRNEIMYIIDIEQDVAYGLRLWDIFEGYVLFSIGNYDKKRYC